MRRRLYILMCFLLCAACSGLEYSPFTPNCNRNLDCDVLMEIDSGWVCGRVRTAEDNVKYASFRGVPYAEQPLGELRFKELQPLAKSKDVLVATEEGPICLQYDETYGRMAHPVGISESCILANIHVPLSASHIRPQTSYKKTGLPILVFIHGGGFQTGSSNSDIHGPEFVVSKNVILITFNYRLNIFGFLSLNSSSIPGNNGLRDAITLLKWVKRNARAFGGDPDNVTLGGQSCGAVAAHLVSLSEASKGLFKRAILMSGVGSGAFYSASPNYAKTVADMLLEYLRINSTDVEEIHSQLIRIPLEKFIEANQVIQTRTKLVSWVPVVESKHPGVTRILDDDPANLVKKGRGKDLPLIGGTTSQECVYFRRRIENTNILGAIEENPTFILPPDITYSVSANVSSKLSQMVIDRYLGADPTVDKFIHYCTNSFFAYPLFKLAQRRASLRGAPVYLYRFSFNSDFNIIKFGYMLEYDGGSSHIEDQTYVLRVNSIMSPYDKSFPPRSRDSLMRYWMTTFVVNFMKCSHPVCDEPTKWPVADAERLNYQMITDPVNPFNNQNLTGELRDMFNFHDRLYDIAGYVTIITNPLMAHWEQQRIHVLVTHSL